MKPASALPTVTVVICTRDRPEALDRCLTVLRAQSHQGIEVLVVDNAPSDGRAREVAERHQVRYLLEPVPGLSRARNAGARASGGEIVAYIDDDAEAEPGWVAGLLPAFADPRVMAVGGRILPLGARTDEQRLYARLSGYEFGGAAPFTLDRGDPDWFARAQFGGVAIGTNMAFRRAAWDIWPGFDERVGPGMVLWNGDESLALLALIDRGHRLAYTPDAIVRHPGPGTAEACRRELLGAATIGAAYLTFIFFQIPGHRLSVLRYVATALVGVRRSWRGPEFVVPAGLLSRGARWRAWLAGPALYQRAKRSWMPAAAMVPS